MKTDRDLLTCFEQGLDPVNLHKSAIPVSVLGYGEISTVLQVGEDHSMAYKRMPLFSDSAAAERYIEPYYEYCRLLTEAGLKLPESETFIVEVPDRPVVLYIAQKKLPPERVGHMLVHSLDQPDFERLIDLIHSEIIKVWSFNKSHKPAQELALDGQLSNWVWLDEDQIYYIDTSTPIFRKNGVEQLDAETVIKKAPFFFRFIVRWFLKDTIINRYYDPRQVRIDLAANLFKEQRPDLIPSTLEIINRRLPADLAPLTLKEVEKYYREDRLIWVLVQTMRLTDRWFTTKILRRRYIDILPGKIKR
ncbi:MAG: hypothetical protein JRG97_10785 [Deltaproteobacteria bacterium]|nr:hypothetical protein [Deltaproteobacteria bacterium]MBW2050937.1 hypothetical protein [Deltaproteobacteria bacterium]MBW2141540.1 hypothetical protein [Deltaproteobacteria bacterium]MBW2323420.1 hypothetical protein [Deltaproteobacteria bacterium]